MTKNVDVKSSLAHSFNIQVLITVIIMVVNERSQRSQRCTAHLASSKYYSRCVLPKNRLENPSSSNKTAMQTARGATMARLGARKDNSDEVGFEVLNQR